MNLTRKKRKNIFDSNKIFMVFVYIMLSIVVICVLYPLIYIISASFSSGQAVSTGKVWLLPVEPNLLAYKTIFKYELIFTGYANTIFYTVVGTMINLVITIMAAYPLSRKDLVGGNLLMFIFTFCMVFGGGLIPYYLVVKAVLGVDNRWTLLLPPGGLLIFYIIVARTYFRNNVPDELREAAEIEGCTNIKFLLSIVLPLSKSIIAVLTLMFAVEHWNSFFGPMIFLQSPRLYPLQLVLRDILIMNSFNASMFTDIDKLMEMDALRELLKYALIVVSCGPVLALYPFVQKYFVKGVMIGSIKG